MLDIVILKKKRKKLSREQLIIFRVYAKDIA